MACSFRAVAFKFHCALDGARDHLLDRREYIHGYGRSHLRPQEMIGETYGNLEARDRHHHLSYPGLRDALDAADEDAEGE